MKLSYRDKVIFICAIVVIILIAGFFLFIKPKYNSMNLAKSSLEIKQSEKADVEAKINTLPELVEQLKASADGVNDVQSYFFSAVNEDDKITVDVNGEERMLINLNRVLTSMSRSFTICLTAQALMCVLF